MKISFSKASIALFSFIFFQSLSLHFTLPHGHAFPGKGSGNLGFNPAGDSEGAQCLNLLGVDLNVLFDVSEPFVNRACHEVGSGGFYIANNHVILNSEYSDELRQELEDMGYPFLGATPSEDLRQKLVSIRFEVKNNATGKIHHYEFSPFEIANEWDYIHDDPLVCGDFFLAACPVALSSPMIAFLPKLPPLPPGSYQIDMYYALSEPFNGGFGTSPGSLYNFDAGETLVFANFLNVVKPAIQSLKTK